MDSIFDSETLKYMICYWIDVQRIEASLSHLVDETDELGEVYEFNRWFKDSVNESDLGFMSIHQEIEKALFKNMDLSRKINSSMPDVLWKSHEVLPEVFGEYNDQIQKSDMDEILEMLLIDSMELFEYQFRDEMFAVFCKTVQRCCKDLFETDSKIIHENKFLSDDELPFS